MVYELLSQSRKINKWGGGRDGGGVLIRTGVVENFLRRTERGGDAHQGREGIFLKLSNVVHV